MSRRIRIFAALAVVIAVIVGLHVAGRFGLRGPTGLSGSELSAWFDDPVAVLATIARWMGLGLAYYLFVAVASIAVLGDHPENEEVTGIRRLVPPGIASAIGIALGITATAGPAAMHMANTEAPSTQEPAALSLMEMDIDDPLVLEEQVTPPAVSAIPATHTDPATRGQALVETTTVVTGESFWSIAEEALLDDAAPGTELDDQTIAEYWRVLIEANRDRLIEPGNPDLILPGQEFVLPPISSSTAP